jgi:hypothetical protein
MAPPAWSEPRWARGAAPVTEHRAGRGPARGAGSRGRPALSPRVPRYCLTAPRAGPGPWAVAASRAGEAPTGGSRSQAACGGRRGGRPGLSEAHGCVHTVTELLVEAALLMISLSLLMEPVSVAGDCASHGFGPR